MTQSTSTPAVSAALDTSHDKIRCAYPPQDPLSPLGEAYSANALELGADVRGGEDAAYGSDPQQRLTVFRPIDPSGIVLVLFHGGGWTNGYKEWMYLMAPPLNAAGVTVVCPTYRLAPKHVFPAGFDDCADAMAWVQANVVAPLGDKARLFVGGHSAGGHYAALLAVTDGWKAARELPAGLLAGCLPISGVYLFGEDSGLSARPRFLGTDTAKDRAASPLLNMTSETMPPFLLSYGSDDFPHLRRQAEAMIAALADRRAPCDVIVLDGLDHFQAAISTADASGPWAARAVAWMRDKAATPTA